MAPIDGLALGVNYGYVDAYFSKEAPGAARSQTNGSRLPGGDVPYAPRHTVFAWIGYELDTPLGPAAFRLDYDYASKWTLSGSVDIDNAVNNATERGLINLRLDLRDIPVDQWGLPGEFSLAVFGKNVSSEHYKTFIIPFGTFDLATFGDLASWGMEAAYRF